MFNSIHIVRKNVLTSSTLEIILHKLCLQVFHSSSFLIAIDVKASLSVIVNDEWPFCLSEAVWDVQNEMWSC